MAKHKKLKSVDLKNEESFNKFITGIKLYNWLNAEEKDKLMLNILNNYPSNEEILNQISFLNNLTISNDLKKEELDKIIQLNLIPLQKTDISSIIKETPKDIDDEDIKVLISNYANEVISEYYIRTFTDTNDIFIYKDGYYSRGETKLATMLDTKFGSEATPYNHNIFLKYITSRTYIERIDFIESETKINLNNGVLDIYTGKLYEHSPEYNFTYKFSINYDINANCPNFNNYINSIVNNDSDRRCLEETLGFILTPGYKFANLVVLFGDGRNGKSTFIKLLTRLVGKQNCSFVAMQDLSNDKFASSDLYLKKANLCADIPNKTIESTGTIKQMTGDDGFRAQEKGKKAFNFMNTAKMIFSCNELPQIKDESPAIWRRLILIDFPNKFIDKNDNKNLLTEITTDEELSGILNIALNGITRLFKNYGFTYNHDTTQERWLEHRLWFNPIDSFWNDCVLFDITTKEKHISKKDLWTIYSYYCETNSIVGVSTSNMFSRCVNNYLNQYSDGWKGGVGNQVRSWIGISLTDKYEFILSNLKNGATKEKINRALSELNVSDNGRVSYDNTYYE